MSLRNRSICPLPMPSHGVGSLRHHLPSGNPELPLLPRRGPSYCFSTHLPFPTSSLEFRIFPPGGDKSVLTHVPIPHLSFLAVGSGGPLPVTQEGPQVLFLPSPQLGVRIQDLLSIWAAVILTTVLAMGSFHKEFLPSPPPQVYILFPISHYCFRNWHLGTQVF